MEGSASSGEVGIGRGSSAPASMADTARWSENTDLSGSIPGASGRFLGSAGSSHHGGARRHCGLARGGLKRRRSPEYRDLGFGLGRKIEREMDERSTGADRGGRACLPRALSPPRERGDGRDRRRRSTACARARSSFQLVKTHFFETPPRLLQNWAAVLRYREHIEKFAVNPLGLSEALQRDPWPFLKQKLKWEKVLNISKMV